MSTQPPFEGPGEPQTPPGLPAYPVQPTSISQGADWAAAPLAGVRPRGPGPGLVYAGFGWRTLGYILDVIIVFVLEAPVSIPWLYVPVAQFYRDHPSATGQTVATLPTDLSNRFVVVLLLGVLVSALYFGALVSWFGRTVGQLGMGLWVVRAEDGGRLPMARAVLRAGIFWGLGFPWATGLLGLVPTVGLVAELIALIAVISAGWDSRRQGWHDKLARSFVVKRVPV
jgi:uncharacterized RDD family membrane protein YckC